MKAWLTVSFLVLSTPISNAVTQVAYTTDLEGSVARWEELLATSSAFGLAPNGRPQLAPGWHFVHGGDVLDRHPGELDILEEMIPLAEAHRSRVHLILGNRDVNKLPLYTLSSRLDPGARRLREFLDLMNARKLFEGHRAQLARRGKSATDFAVGQSLAALAGPDGWLRRYVAAGKVALVIDETLYVHGAWRVTDARRSLLDQVTALDLWKTREFEHWVATDGHGGDALLRAAHDQSFVMYSHYSDSSWAPTWPSEHEIDHLKASGVHRIVVGHRTYGETPALLRRPDFEMIFADTSGCEDCGVPILEIEGPRVRVRSRLGGGQAVDFAFVRGDETPFGKVTREGHLLVGRTAEGSWVTYSAAGSTTRVWPADRLVREGFAWTIGPATSLVSDETFDRILATEDHFARVRGLKELDGSALTPAQIAKLVAAGSQLWNSFEMGQYVRLAAESGHRDFLPLLARWRAQWTPPREKWHVPLAREAERASAKIACEHDLEST